MFLTAFAAASAAAQPASNAPVPPAAVAASSSAIAALALPQSGAAGAGDLVSRGRYLALAADCMACHSAAHRKPFSGGYGIATPLGTVYSTNITPSRANGIGAYTEAEFSNAIRRGIRRDGSHLYPAMPYTSYAKLSDPDVHALYRYFMAGVAPVDEPIPQATDLRFPFGFRGMMALWNGLFLDTAAYATDPSKSVEWNRGAYLATALGHCDACHTPRNFMMSEIGSQNLAGAALGSWYAPNITSDPVSGIGGWTDTELATYLKTGHVAGKAQAAGPMAEAIENSLQHLSDGDIKALVTYLGQTPAISTPGADKARYAYGGPSTSEQTMRGAVDPDKGWLLFSGSCAACHQVSATGTANHDYPSLFHNTATGGVSPNNLIATIVFGLKRTVNDKLTYMPGFGAQASYTERLSDTEIAAVANYVLKQYGHPTAAVTAQDVETVRNGGPTPLLARLVPLAMGGVVILAILLLAWLVVRARKKSTHTIASRN